MLQASTPWTRWGTERVAAVMVGATRTYYTLRGQSNGSLLITRGQL